MVLVLGLADRVGTFPQVPDVLGRWEVLAVAAVLYAFEFVADKIPYVDSVWDVVSTAIRPVVGGVVGVLIAGDSTSLNEPGGRGRRRGQRLRVALGEDRHPDGGQHRAGAVHQHRDQSR
ncbi:DUF4126 domain-containing protein [Nocardioides convexus]|uniref:DUF4126 domain-containing protein n=1 Tax=Nocardioides convexus TaxID=2712224 RepID=UPI002418714B|nr:DUF4126 domain-containing protein [Nocardioides convexus]